MWEENFKKYSLKRFAMEKISDESASQKIEAMLDELKNNFGKPEKHLKIFKKSKELALSILFFKYGFEPKKTLEECFELGVKKNSDYGSDNILRFGERGLIIRISDKYARVQNLLKKVKTSVGDEKIEDTLEDIINYSIYGDMLTDNVWS